MSTMIRRFSMISCLLLLPLAGACEGGPPWATSEESASPDREDFGTVAAYERLLLFVGPGETTPMAAIFDFNALRDSTGFRRGIRTRLLTDSAWQALQDDGWEMAPMREPWRLVPYGTLKVLVGDEGELDALVYQEEPSLRLDPGSYLAEYTPDGGTQLVLRQGQLHLDDEVFTGIILDSQHGRALTGAVRQQTSQAAPSPPGSDTTEEDIVDDGEADAEGAAAGSPSARAGVEAFLLDNSGYYVVFATSANGDLTWLHLGTQDDVRRGTTLEATEWEDGGPADGSPIRWRVASPDGALDGEVEAIATDDTPLYGRVDVSALSYALVSGWIQDREVRREVFGLIRHVR